MFPMFNAERAKPLTHYLISITLSHSSIHYMVSKVENCESSVFTDQNLLLVTKKRLFGSRSPKFNRPHLISKDKRLTIKSATQFSRLGGSIIPNRLNRIIEARIFNLIKPHANLMNVTKASNICPQQLQ